MMVGPPQLYLRPESREPIGRASVHLCEFVNGLSIYADDLSSMWWWGIAILKTVYRYGSVYRLLFPL